MPSYKCHILDKDGHKSVRVIDAPDYNTLKANVMIDHSYLISAKKIQEKKKNTFFAMSSKVKSVEIVLFLRQFSTMINSGATITESLNALKRQKHSSTFTRVLQDVYDDVQSGVLLSTAFSRHPKVFPEYFQNMIGIGEASGSLDKVLGSLAAYYENDRKIRSKAISAMIYPIILLVLIVALVFFMTLFVIPQFESIINELGGNVPLITKIVMDISEFFQNYIFIILPVLIGVILLIRIYFSTKSGKLTKDFLKLHLPLIGRVQKELITSRFSKAFIILLESGMNISDAMENLKRMLGNENVKKRFHEVIDKVNRGVSVHEALDALHFFPEILIDMIAVGERSGDLESVLKSTSAYFDERVEAATVRATNAIEPIMIISLGVVVGFVILAIYLPIISLMQSI